MQPFFFIRHPAALFAYECWIFYDIYKFIKFFSYILFLPFAKPFRLFRHFVLLYIKIHPSGFKLLGIRNKVENTLQSGLCIHELTTLIKPNLYKDFLSGWN